MSQQYSRKSSDIFALQGELAKEITGMLRMRLTGEDNKRIAKSYTANPEAYQDYLKGRYWLNKANEEGLNRGIGYFREAIAKDPTYALAYTGLADGYAALGGLSSCSSERNFPESEGGSAQGVGTG